MSWDFLLFHYDSNNGFGVRPQLKIGAQSGDGSNVGFSFGLGDVRDGLQLDASAGGVLVFEHEAESYDDMIHKTKLWGQNLQQEQGAGNVFGLLDHVTNQQASIYDAAMKIIPNNPRTGKKLNRNSMFPGAKKFKFITKIDLKVGGGGTVNLGWTDTKGFHMIGVAGNVALIAEVGIGYQFGWHNTENKFREIISFLNVTLETIKDI